MLTQLETVGRDALLSKGLCGPQSGEEAPTTACELTCGSGALGVEHERDLYCSLPYIYVRLADLSDRLYDEVRQQFCMVDITVL